MVEKENEDNHNRYDDKTTHNKRIKAILFLSLLFTYRGLF
jgi:hypothetical protein